MKISLMESTRKSINKDLDFNFIAEDFTIGHDSYKVLTPVKVTGHVKVISGIIDLNVVAKTKIATSCNRCLENYERDINVEINEKLSKNVSDDDLDTIQLTESDTVDLTDIITKGIISSLSIQNLCDENCKGLCQKCGTNLNQMTCDCDKDQVDIRLEALKDIFKEV